MRFPQIPGIDCLKILGQPCLLAIRMGLNAVRVPSQSFMAIPDAMVEDRLPPLLALARLNFTDKARILTPELQSLLLPFTQNGYQLGYFRNDGNCGFYALLIGLYKLKKINTERLFENGIRMMFKLRRALQNFVKNILDQIWKEGGGPSESNPNVSKFEDFMQTTENYTTTVIDILPSEKLEDYVAVVGEIGYIEPSLKRFHYFAHSYFFAAYKNKIRLVTHVLINTTEKKQYICYTYSCLDSSKSSMSIQISKTKTFSCIYQI